jgi:hypothetical protein
MVMSKNPWIGHVLVCIGIWSTLVLNGCATYGGSILYEIMEKDGIGEVCSSGIYDAKYEPALPTKGGNFSCAFFS